MKYNIGDISLKIRNSKCPLPTPIKAEKMDQNNIKLTNTLLALQVKETLQTITSKRQTAINKAKRMCLNVKSPTLKI